MTLPGLLIEYLVNGAIALVWLYPFVETHLKAIEPALVPVLLAALYVIGMVIDVIAWAATRPLKHHLRRRVHRKYAASMAPESVSGTMRHAKIALHAPELARELATRSSRDRIARGSIINALLAAGVALPWWVGVPAVIGSVVVWGMFEKLSYMYELCAERVVDERLKSSART